LPFRGLKKVLKVIKFVVKKSADNWSMFSGQDKIMPHIFAKINQ